MRRPLPYRDVAEERDYRRLDEELHAYLRSARPPPAQKALANALLREHAAQRDVEVDLRDRLSDTGRHVILEVEEAQRLMLFKKLNVERDAAAWRWLRTSAGRVATTLTAVLLGAIGAWLWGKLNR